MDYTGVASLRFPDADPDVDQIPWKRLLDQEGGRAEKEPESAYVQHCLIEGCIEASSSLKRSEYALRYAECLVRVVRNKVMDSMRPSNTPESPGMDVTTAVESLVSRADAELGAQVFRDLILSFTLPRGVTRLRHTLLLSRTLNGEATKNYPSLVDHAHRAALQGPSQVWQHGVTSAGTIVSTEVDEAPGERDAQFLHDAQRIHDEAEQQEQSRLNNLDYIAAANMERSCVILAGLAMLFAPSSAEARKGIAFQGRVRLPFLTVPLHRVSATSATTDTHSVVELLEDGSWAYVAAVNGTLQLKYRGQGLHGLSAAASLLMLDASR